MESIKSPKFILMAIALIGTFILAGLKIVSGSETLALIGGLLGGVGVAAGKMPNVKSLLAVLLPLSLLAGGASGCATMPVAGQVIKEVCTRVPAAIAAAEGVCAVLPQDKQKECLEKVQKGAKFLNIGVAVGASIVGTCPIDQ